MNSDLLSIVIPTYNEKDNLRKLIAEIDAALLNVTPYEIIFVDDSTDETPFLLAEIAAERQNVSFVHREEKSGLASAVVLGFSLAKGSIIAVMDADLQHPPELLAVMFNKIIAGADVVLPSRYIAGGGDEGLNAFRKFASNTAKYIGKLLLPSLHKVSDPTSGYFMMKSSVIAGKTLKPTGWKIMMEVLVLGEYSTVEEIPYEFRERNAGESKMGLKVTLQYFLHVLSLIWRSERDRRFYLFALVGLSGVVVDMLIFRLLGAATAWHVNLRATLSALTAMCSNYLLNRNFTWKSVASSNAAQEFAKYVAVSSVGIGIKNLFVLLFVAVSFAPWLANLLGIVAAALFNYFLTDRWVFNSRKKA